MFIRDEFGQWTFVPKGLCFIEGEGNDDAGGGGAEGDQGGEGAAAGDGDAASGEGDQGGAAAGAGESNDAGSGNQGEDWRAHITDEKARDYAKQFNSPAEAAVDAFKRRQQLSTAIIRPGKDASAEDVAAFQKALGVPEAAADYKLALPDGVPEDDAGITGFRELAHKANISNEAAQQVAAWYFEQVGQQEADQQKEMDEAQAEQRRSLEKDWGRDLEANTEFAVRAARGIGGDEFVDFIDNVQVDGVRLGDHTQFLKTFAKVGRLMAEDNPLIGVSSEQVQSMTDEHHVITGQIMDASDRGDRQEVARLTRQRDALNAKLGKDEPVVGSQGRTL